MLSVSTLSRLENGQRRPTLEVLLALASAYHVSLEDMVGAPETGDPRVRLRPRQVKGRTVVPLTQAPDGVQAWKVVIPAGMTSPVLRRHEGPRGIIRPKEGAPGGYFHFEANKGGKNVDLGTEFRNFEAGVKGSGGRLRLIGGKNSTYGGVRGAERVYALKHSGGELRMRVWFGNGAKNLYSFQVTDSAARFAKSDALFKRVLGTVRFR